MTRKTSPAVPPALESAAGNAPNRMWGGRFEASPDEAMEAINASIDFDRRLYAEDIAGSVAHVTMLAAQGNRDAGRRSRDHGRLASGAG